MDPPDPDPQRWVLVCLHLSITLGITTDRDQPFFRRISELTFFGDVNVKKTILVFFLPPFSV
jgi:hypothetical protein